MIVINLKKYLQSIRIFGLTRETINFRSIGQKIKNVNLLENLYTDRKENAFTKFQIFFQYSKRNLFNRNTSICRVQIGSLKLGLLDLNNSKRRKRESILPINSIARFPSTGEYENPSFLHIHRESEMRSREQRAR